MWIKIIYMYIHILCIVYIFSGRQRNASVPYARDMETKSLASRQCDSRIFHDGSFYVHRYKTYSQIALYLMSVSVYLGDEGYCGL